MRIFLLALVCTASLAYGQRKKQLAKSVNAPVQESAAMVDMNLFKKYPFRSIGPATMSGRVTAIDAVWEDPEHIIVGTASGGVWESTNGGATWKPIFDDINNLNIGSVAIQQSNPSVIWVGTGEGNPRNSINLGGGIYKSMDGGKTWKSMGLEKTINIHRIFIDPNNPNVVYAGAIGNPFAAHPERGVFKTVDGGKTWNKILFTNDLSGVGDMVMDPSNPNKLIVNMWEHKRTPYDFKSGGAGSGMYITWDGGENWKKMDDKNGLPSGELGKMGFAIAPSKPNIIYALIESKKNALYRSEDGGMNWKKLTDEESVANNRPFYFFDLAVDPSNENRVYNIYQMISLSEDGGKNFRVIVPYSGVHPDHHAFWIHPKDGNYIINGNDGGVAISRDRGEKWTFMKSIPVGQFYHVNVDNDIPYNIYGGLQDNGSWKGPAYTWMTGGIRNQYWEVVLFGDGFDVVPDPMNSRYGWAMSQGGNLARYDALTGSSEFIKPTHPDANVRLRFNWNAAISYSRTGNLYYGSQFVHKSSDKGMNWEIISPDLTTNNADQIKASDNSGGLTMDITSAENHNSILCIEPSPLDEQVLWVGTDDGNVQVSTNGGTSWQEVSGKMAGLPEEAWIPQIRASRYNAGEAFVVANDYRNGDTFVPYVYRTKDFGATWERMVDQNKVEGYALSVLQDPVEKNLIFVGTEHGLWVSFDNGSSFNRYKHGIPAVSAIDLAIQERESDLVVGTFGRAIYVLDNIAPLREMAAKSTKKVASLKPTDAYLAEIKDAPGIMFGADEMYEGENRAFGALLPYYAHPTGKKSKADSTKMDFTDTLHVYIFKENEQIRHLQHKIDTVGFGRINWQLDEKGTRYPGSRKPKKDDPERGGINVLPGTYKIVMDLNGEKDSTTITVYPDPRMPVNSATEAKKRELYSKLEVQNNRLVVAMDQLDEAQKLTEDVMKRIKEAEVLSLDSLKKKTAAIQDSIKNVTEIIEGKKFKRQGYGRPYQITAISKMREARGYIRSKSIITAAEEALVNQAEKATEEAIQAVNAFFKEVWPTYRKEVEDADLPYFKEYEPIK